MLNLRYPEITKHAGSVHIALLVGLDLGYRKFMENTYILLMPADCWTLFKLLNFYMDYIGY